MNSIANLILHLTGNVRQIIVSSVGGAPDIRERQAEFDARESLTKSQILDGLRAVIGEASAVLERQSEAAWQRIVQFQGKDISALGIAIRSVTHFRGHTQEIIHLTRTILDDRYRYVGPPPKPRS